MCEFPSSIERTFGLVGVRVVDIVRTAGTCRVTEPGSGNTKKIIRRK